MSEDADLKVFLSCECHCPEHTVIVSVFDWGNEMPYKPDFIIDIQASNFRPFWKRFIPALKYIFGAELTWNDVIIQKEDIPKLQAAINHYNKLLKNNDKKVVDKVKK